MSSEGAPEIDVALVRKLLSLQAPRWAGLPVVPVDPQGWDNRTFRLGADMSVRVPSRAVYAAQLEIEAAWLPVLAQHLPLRIPTVIFTGGPSEVLPWGWALRDWIEGETAARELIPAPCVFAQALGEFLKALQAAPAAGGPRPGARNFYRGGDPGTYDREARDAISRLGLRPAASKIWERAITSRPLAEVWVHGDISPGNMLVRDGRLAAVIDFGLLAVGDPACDMAIAWTFMDRGERDVFRAAVHVDEATWDRAKGWALWKSAMVCAGLSGRPGDLPLAKRALRALLEDG